MSVAACRRILERLAALPEAQRREVRGLHPDRAPTIVAGIVMVIEALELFGLDSTAVSDHDILRGAALEVVHRARPNGEVNAGVMNRSGANDHAIQAHHGARGSRLATRNALRSITTSVGPPGRMYDGAALVRRRTIAALAKGCSCRHGMGPRLSAS